jgi:hypothetical protein
MKGDGIENGVLYAKESEKKIKPQIYADERGSDPRSSA